MIPHRVFPGEFSNSGLKDRVTACRKRLRESRGLRATASGGVESLFSCGADATTATIRGNGSRLEVAGVQDEALIMIENQEVGIT